MLLPWLLICLCAGILAASNALVGAGLFSAALSAACARLYYRSNWRASWRWLRNWRRWYLHLFAGVALSACSWFWAQAQLAHLPQPLPEPWEKQEFELSGVVLGLPQKYDNRTRLRLRVDEARLVQGAEVELGELELTWYRPEFDVKTGDKLSLRARLNNYRNYGNPGAFDFAEYKRSQGLQARGYIHCCVDQSGNTANSISAMRAAISARIDAHPGLEHSGLIKALLLGERSEIDSDVRRIMRNVGISHLLAISGLHISLVALIFWQLARQLLKLPLALGWLRSSHGLALFISLLAASTYAALSGWQLPAQRALLMLVVIVALKGFSFKANNSIALLVALTVVLVLDPLAWRSPGFWLSFAAVSILLAQSSGWSRTRYLKARLWRFWLRPQLLITIGLAPFVLLFWQQLSAWSVPLNLLLIPLVGSILMPLLALATLSLGWAEISSILLLGSDYLLRALEQLLLLVDSLPPLYLQIPAPQPTSIALALLAFGVLIVPLPWRSKWPAWLILLALLAPVQAPRPEPGSAWVTVLDVGQGLAVHIATAEHDLLYDTGASSATIIDFLRHQAIGELDELILSHSDSDHSGGAEVLLKQTAIKRIRANFDLDYPRWQQLETSACQRGQNFSYDGVDFQVLHPQADKLFSNENRNSCVVRISAQGQHLLLTGDIDSQVERQLLRWQPETLAAQVLVAPHHGSKSSSSPAFIEAVAPEKVIFSSGYKNHFGHPHPQVIQRYQGSSVYSSSEHGALSIRLEPNGASVSKYYQ